MIVKNTIDIHNDAEEQYKDPIKKSELKPILKPRANAKFLGTYSGQYIWLKQRARTDTTKFNAWWARQFGTEPRFVDTLVMDRSMGNIENYLFNNGYFSGKADYDVEQKKPGQAIVHYSAYPGRQHVYGNYFVEIPDSNLKVDLLDQIDFDSQIKPGHAFNAENLTSIRDQMMENSQEKGYYEFSKGSIYIDVDTLQQEDRADIHIVVDNTEDSLYNKKFYIRNIYTSIGQGINDSYLKPVEYNDKFYANSKIVKVRPSVLDRFILMQKGDLYSKSAERATYNKLYDLPIVKYPSIKYQVVKDSLDHVVEQNDSLYLDVFIDANAKKLMNPQLQFTVSQFQGPAIGLEGNFTHRNIFKGGEVFNFSISGGLESINNSQSRNQLFGNRIFSISPELIVPRLLLLENIYPKTYYKTQNQRTTISFNYDSRNEVDLFRLRSLGFKTKWEFQTNPRNKHTIGLIDVSRLRNTIYPLYDSILQNQPTVRFSLQPRLILGSNYTYNYSNSDRREDNKTWINFQGTADFSGNMVNLFSSKDYVQIGKDTVSQYVRGIVDFSVYKPFSERVSWVNHMRSGVAYPIGPIKTIPAVKQFYLGGSTSMRGWRPRSLGPGTYFNPDIGPNDNVDNRGDVLFEFNTELRFPLTKIFGLPLNGAGFADLGNIWSLYENDNIGGREGAQFDANDFYREFGLDVGTGLRLDIQGFLVVRTDFAWKLRDPSLPVNERWVESPFSGQNLNVIFGLGYPFE